MKKNYAWAVVNHHNELLWKTIRRLKKEAVYESTRQFAFAGLVESTMNDTLDTKKKWAYLRKLGYRVAKFRAVEIT